MIKAKLVWQVTTFSFFLLAATAKAEDSISNTPPVRALVTAKVETILSGQIAGKIIALKRKLGQRFKKDDTLIEFACEIHQAELNKSRANYRAAKAKLVVNKKLLLRRAIGQLEVLTAEAESDALKAEINIRLAVVNMCKVVAPFNGRIVQHFVKSFQYVNAGEALIEILDDSQLQLELYIPSKWYPFVKSGTQFKVTIDETGKTYDAIVTNIAAKVVSVSQNLLLHANVKQTHKTLLSGMSGNAYFALPRSSIVK